MSPYGVKNVAGNCLNVPAFPGKITNVLYPGRLSSTVSGSYYRRFVLFIRSSYRKRRSTMKRQRMSRSYSKKSFTRGALNIHPKNSYTLSGVMRGGIRL